MTSTSLLSALILSALPASNIAARGSNANLVYRCDFEQEYDKNYDSWPDNWKRRAARGYPTYLPIEIVNDDSRPNSPHCLRIALDGGAALVHSPRIPITPQLSYFLRVAVKTERLKHDEAYCKVSFLDAEYRTLEAYASEKLTRSQRWRELQIGPVTPKDQNARWAVIELRLEPTDHADLVGEARFDDLWFGSLPRMTVSTGRPINLFTDAKDIAITCSVSGFSADHSVLRFELMDIDGNVLQSREKPLRIRQAESATSGATGVAEWKEPPIPQTGFYVVRTSLPGESGSVMERSIKLVVVDEQPITKKGEFGWSLPQSDRVFSLKVLADLMSHAGIHWAKFPIWYSGDDRRRADNLAAFAERLGAKQIQLIGLLDSPPNEVREVLGEKGPLPVASVFNDANVWSPYVDPVMTRLSLKVRWWQLGGDNDTSFVNYPNLEDRIRGIRRDLNRFGQEINLGIALRAVDEAPLSREAPPWSFLSFTSDPPLTAEEVRAYFLRKTDDSDENAAQRWVVSQPISRKHYDLKTRASDLVVRMLTAKMMGVDGIFIPDPFDPEHGLIDEDGSPNELLLAWRTVALMVSGADYLGSVELPRGSSNHFFVRGKQAVMVAWNDTTVEEVVYLGQNVEQVDLWGRKIIPPQRQDGHFTRQVIKVGKLPTFVTNVSADIARWRMGFRLETERLASVFGQDQTGWYRFTNTFENSVGGDVTLRTAITPDPLKRKIKLAPGEEGRQQFHVVLGANIKSGAQPIQADFELGEHGFSVYRQIEVGLGDIDIEIESKLDENTGNLIVKQHLDNKQDDLVSFNCLLFAQGRVRQRRQVYNLGRGKTTNVFIFRDGKELIGTRLNLRAEEINGIRILNYHHTPRGQ